MAPCRASVRNHVVRVSFINSVRCDIVSSCMPPVLSLGFLHAWRRLSLSDSRLIHAAFACINLILII